MSPLAEVLAAANRQPPAPPQTQVATTPVASIYANNDAQKMDAYKANLGQQNSMFGGLASLGGAGISALGPKLFGAGAGAGADAAGTIGTALGIGSDVSDADLLLSMLAVA